MTTEERDQLRQHTQARRQLLRRGVVSARESVDRAHQIIRSVIEEGEPTNGLLDALTQVAAQLSRQSDALQRTETAQFEGDREMVFEAKEEAGEAA